jgi:hypothetical protein
MATDRLQRALDRHLVAEGARARAQEVLKALELSKLQQMEEVFVKQAQ